MVALNVLTGEWRELPGSESAYRRDAALVSFGDHCFVIGGYDKPLGYRSDLFVYDVVRGTVSDFDVPHMAQARVVEAVFRTANACVWAGRSADSTDLYSIEAYRTATEVVDKPFSFGGADQAYAHQLADGHTSEGAQFCCWISTFILI